MTTYAVVAVINAPDIAKAKALAAPPILNEKYKATIVRMAESKCPAGYDHAHAQYDGATYCPGCESYFVVRLDKRQNSRKGGE